VIVALHHEQDMRKMGGLRHRMPVTYWTSLIGALALIGTPFFSGFYSKDALIEVVGESHRAGAGYAYFCVLAGVFVTALYTFRQIFMVFFGEERMDHHTAEHFHDVGWDMKGPLVALAVPSVIIGYLTIGPLLFGDYFGQSIFVREANDVVGELGKEFTGPVAFGLHAFVSLPFWLALAGVSTAWLLFLKDPQLADRAAAALAPVRRLLDNKYYFDWFNEHVIARCSRLLGGALWRGGDRGLIDGVLIDGTAGTIGRTALAVRVMQSGYLYSYAFWMITGLVALVGWFLYKL
jgi:NADH-quinone oxidoreductase subunit L